MEVQNNSWQLVGDASPASLRVQNVGIARIAYVFAASQPAADAIDLDTGQHFIMHPGDPIETFSGMNTNSVSMYARALGPVAGKLSVASYAP
jgi:hypothetical protein